MTTPVKLFTASLTDEYGYDFADCLVAVRQFSETSQKTGATETFEGDYAVESQIEGVSYKANYWYSQTKKAEGKRSRPLKQDVDGELTDVFVVDLDAENVVAILDSANSHDDKILAAIIADIENRF